MNDSFVLKYIKFVIFTIFLLLIVLLIGLSIGLTTEEESDKNVQKPIKQIISVEPTTKSIESTTKGL